MSTDRHLLTAEYRRHTSGVALVVTLALLVLVTVAVVAFLSRSATNLQISSSSDNGVLVDVYSTGASDAIIANLQSEMLAGSLAAPAPTPATPAAGAPYIMPLTNSYAVSPSRSLQSGPLSSAAPGTDPNALYFQFANLVKQSAYNVSPYNVPAAPGSNGTAVQGAYIASDVQTLTPNPDGRFYDGTFWAQPRLVSVPVTGANGTTDLAPLIPYWVYTDRTGTPVLPGDMTNRIASGNSMNPKNVVGRYAYNIYNIGGTLNANMVANGLPQNTVPALGSGSSAAANEIVPGYKGSTLTADLSGLTLNGALKFGGSAVQQLNSDYSTPSGWPVLPKWRATGNWNNNATNFSGFAYILAGGQFNGWLNDFFQPFDPVAGTLNTNAAFLTNNRFSSRQDLINWVNKYWGNTSDTTGQTTWMLPYLTHFSYDTDAPTFAPDPARPKVQQSAYNVNGTPLGMVGENDAYGFDYNTINPPFVGPSPVTVGAPQSGGVILKDVNGNPLIKRRFPLSALSLIANYGPGSPFPTTNTTLAAQIRYDFGLVWSNSLTDSQTGEKSPGWVYQDVDSDSPPIRILQLSQIDPSRSPNFFELLKAAINVGSIGKQYGNPYDSSDAANAVGSGSRYGVTNYQIMQIGANIISQTSTTYTPTHIQFNGTNDFYGVQDFPYLYRTRQLPYLLDNFAGDAMAVKTPATGAPHGVSVANSALAARVVQTELWNPHAPNQVTNPTANSATGYPQIFRVVPTQYNVSYTQMASGATQWVYPRQTGGTTFPFGSLSNFIPAGGVDCTTGIAYPQLIHSDAAHPPTYLTVPAIAPGVNSYSTLATFREPCGLIATNVPPGLVPFGAKTTGIGNFNSAMPTSGVDLSIYRSNTTPPAATNAIPTVFTANTGPAGQEVFGFNLGYSCAGPNGMAHANWLSVDAQFGVTMTLSLQYSVDGGKTYYTYDVVDSAGGSHNHENEFNNTTNACEFQFEQGTRVDPRSHRWGFMSQQLSNYAWDDYTKNEFQGETASSGYTGFTSGVISTPIGGKIGGSRQIAELSSWSGTYITGNPALGYAQINQPPAGVSPAQESGSAKVASTTYYQDPDGVVRLADGAYTNYSDSGGQMPVVNPNTLGLPMLMPTNPVTGSSVIGQVPNLDSRPVVLNRPFQSVTELGYVFRDTPWRSLDFFTPQSGDNALLDVFTAYGPDPWSYASSSAAKPAASNPANTATSFVNEMGLVTGRVDLNTAQAPVLAALIQGTLVNTPITNTAPLKMIDASSNVAASVANALVAWTHKQGVADQGPLRNRAELVGKYVPSTGSYAGFSFGDPNVPAAQLTTLLAPLGAEAPIIKQQRECIVRALADVGTTRTWNLLIDVVAQTGRLTNNASSLKNFLITGEKHQWVSVAIDRVTGRIIKMQAETVRN